MNNFSIDDLKTLVEQAQGICVSIFMPTQRAGAETRQNAIRFKNLIKQVEAQLQEYDLRNPDASALLQPVLDLDEEAFWQHQDAGLAIFLAQGFLRYYCLPLSFEELAVVNFPTPSATPSHFHLKPLLPLITRDSEFYILALSQKHIRFFAATRYSIHEQEVEGLPQNMDEALQYDETAKDGQFRIGTTAGHGGNGAHRAGSFHGQGSPDRDQHQKDILQFFYLVDQALQEVLRHQQAPLLLAGVEYLMPIYRQANTYPHLIETVIHTENVQVVKPEDLHTEVLPIVEPLFSQAEQAAIEHYQELVSTGKTSTDLNESISAAYYGRIDQLFVPVGLQKWGKFDMQCNTVEIHEEAQPGDEDLLDAAAVQTILNGGQVFAVEPEKVPEMGAIAAVFRY